MRIQRIVRFKPLGEQIVMSLRAINRRCWISGTSGMLASVFWFNSQANADFPLVAAKVGSLAPIAADQTAPVITAMTIDPTGNWLAIAGDDQTIRILQANDFEQVALLRGHRDLIRSVAFRVDGKVLASAGNDGSLILWEKATGFKKLNRVDELPAICSLRFTTDGTQLAAVGFGNEVLMFGGTKNRQTMICDCNDLRSIAFDPEGKRLVAAGRSGHIHLFDAQSGRELGSYELHKGRIRQCEFSRQGNSLITVAEDGAAVVFDLDRAEVTQRIEVLPCKLFTLVQLDDKHIAVAGSDNRIRIINLDTAAIVSYLDGHRGSISNLVYSNGSLFSGGFDATIRKWPIAADRDERLAENDAPPVPPKETSSR